jgi:hypothetical protein
MIYMESYYENGTVFGDPSPDETIRLTMGLVQRLSERIDLAFMVPRNDLASTQYCLAHPVRNGAQYLVYQPGSASVKVNLSASPVQLNYEWINAATGKTLTGGTVTGGSVKTFAPPIAGDTLLYLWDANAAQ